MTNPKKQLEEPMTKKIQEIISKAIENKLELKIDDNLETNLENFTISHDDFWDYINVISDLLSYSQMTLSKTEMNSYYSSLEKCDFTKNDFFDYLTLEGQIWKVLDENVLDKEYVRDAYDYSLENDFDDFMTGNREKVFELNFDQTDVWKELEPRIEKGQLPREPLTTHGGIEIELLQLHVAAPGDGGDAALNLSRVLHDPEALEGGRGRSQLGLLPVDVEDTAFVLGEDSCDDADDAVGIGVVAGPNAGDARIEHVDVRL